MGTSDTEQELQLMKKSIDEFVKREVHPVEEEYEDVLVPDYAGLQPDGRLKDRTLEAINTIRRKSAETGFYGMHMPESVGGMDVGLREQLDLIQHIYSHGFGLNVRMVEAGAGPSTVYLNLDDDLVDEFLRPAVRAEKTACFAMTESSSGSDALDMRTTATKDGDEWVISGEKMWITNAPYADFGQVYAVTDPEAKKSRRISAFFFDTSDPAFEVKRVIRILLNDGDHAEVAFNDLRVPDRYLMGERGRGLSLALENINETRLKQTARCAGLMDYLADRTVDYANDRTSWGAPIGQRQHVRRLVADIVAWQATAETLLQRGTWEVGHGNNAIQACAIANRFATQKLFEAADNAIQVFGGNGLTHEYGIERILRRARVMRVSEGTVEMQTETIAKEAGLGRSVGM
jgi:acyl-CoA dehydrogenase